MHTDVHARGFSLTAALRSAVEHEAREYAERFPEVPTPVQVRLFDVYRDEKIGTGKKSLAYSLTYQSDKTMTDAEAAAIRHKIVKRLEYEVGAKLRS